MRRAAFASYGLLSLAEFPPQTIKLPSLRLRGFFMRCYNAAMLAIFPGPVELLGYVIVAVVLFVAAQLLVHVVRRL